MDRPEVLEPSVTQVGEELSTIKIKGSEDLVMRCRGAALTGTKGQLELLQIKSLSVGTRIHT